MGIFLRRLLISSSFVLVVAASACEQRLVAIARGPGAGGQDSAGGAGGRGGHATETGGHDGSGGEGEEATSSTASGSGGEGASGCATPKPVGNVAVCGECGDGGGGSEFPCKCKLCDSLDHEWQAECTATGCTCSYDSAERCSCLFDKPQESCNAIENCCPDWPQP